MDSDANTLDIKISKTGAVFFDQVEIHGMDILLGLLRIATLRVPQPRIQIVCLGDRSILGRVVFQTQLADFPSEKVFVVSFANT